MCLDSQRRLELRILGNAGPVKTGNSWRWTECILHNELDMNLWGKEVECYSLDKYSTKAKKLHAWLPTCDAFGR